MAWILALGKLGHYRTGLSRKGLKASKAFGEDRQTADPWGSGISLPTVL
jgi:hypothetical protein